MVLSSNDIREAMARKELVIEPFDVANLTPNGYLLTVDKASVPKVHWTIKEGFVPIGKQTRFVVNSRERLRLGPGMTATITIIGELHNKGIIASLPRLDAGFDGKVVMSAFNSSIRTVDIQTGQPFVEVVFDTVTGTRADAVAPKAAPVKADDVVGSTGLRLDPRDGGRPCLENGCTNCCHGTEMPLTENDMVRLRSLGYEDFWVEEDGWMTLRNIDGRCHFLERNRCKIYNERPVGCTFYPAVFSMEDQAAILDQECPQRNEFSVTSTLTKDIKVLVETIRRERKQRKFRR
jgi:Fe-S-cluster containining protein/deoxycytidine triphosphate deaminase